MADETVPDVRFEGPNEMQMADWLERALRRYAATMIIRKSREFIEFSQDEIKNFPLHITSLRYSSRGNDNPSDLETDTNNHTISEIAITYCLSRDGIHRPQSFLSKASRALCNNEKGSDMDEESLFRVQEINFYTKVVPGLEDWAFRNGDPMELPLPYCYFGNYECTKIERVDKRTKNYLTSIGIKYKGYDEDMKNMHPNGFDSTYDPTEGYDYEMNTVIVLEDATKVGYKQFAQFQLTVKQVEVAAKKIAEVHALSYAWETSHENHITQKWPIFMKSRHFAKICSDSILKAFPTMIKLMKDYFKDESTSAVIHRLEKLETKIQKKLLRFLRPAKYMMPNCILHMDLRPPNIFFREESSVLHGEDPNECLATVVHQKSPGFENQMGDTAALNSTKEKIKEMKITEEHEDKPEIKECRFIGWNICNFGQALHDIALLIFTSLSPELRRNSTIQILKTYYAHFMNVSDDLGVEVPFTCQMLYDEFPNSLLFAALMSVRHFNDLTTNIDAEHLNHFVEVFSELMHLNYI